MKARLPRLSKERGHFAFSPVFHDFQTATGPLQGWEVFLCIAHRGDSLIVPLLIDCRWTPGDKVLFLINGLLCGRVPSLFGKMRRNFSQDSRSCLHLTCRRFSTTQQPVNQFGCSFVAHGASPQLLFSNGFGRKHLMKFMRCCLRNPELFVPFCKL